jgi:hypothetical protein
MQKRIIHGILKILSYKSSFPFSLYKIGYLRIGAHGEKQGIWGIYR